MKSISASFAAMSKTLTEMGKAMRQERMLETQEAERQRRTEPPVPGVSTVPTVPGIPPFPESENDPSLTSKLTRASHS